MCGYSRTNIDYELKLSFMKIKSSPVWEGLYRSSELIEEFHKKMNAFIFKRNTPQLAAAGIKGI